jgi:hypothetical protein
LKDGRAYVYPLIIMHGITGFVLATVLFCMIIIFRNIFQIVIITGIVMLNTMVLLLCCSHAELNYHYFWFHKDPKKERIYFNMVFFGIFGENIPQFTIQIAYAIQQITKFNRSISSFQLFSFMCSGYILSTGLLSKSNEFGQWWQKSRGQLNISHFFKAEQKQ